MSILTATFPKSAKTPAVTFVYESEDAAVKAQQLLRRRIDIEQFGIDPRNDKALEGYTEGVRLVVGYDGKKDFARALALFTALLEPQGDWQRNEASFRSGEGRFSVLEQMDKIPAMIEQADAAGFTARVHKNGNDFDARRPLQRNGRRVTLHFRAPWEGQEQGIALGRIVQELEKAGLQPHHLVVSPGMAPRRLRVAFNDFAKGVGFLKEPRLPVGFNLNADYFIENADAAEKTVILRGPRGLRDMLTDAVLEDGLAVKIRALKP